MTTPSSAPHPERKWYSLSLRHLRMASRLLRRQFPDGAFFHAYHAFECAISAFIAAKHFPVPPDGKTTVYGVRRKVYIDTRGRPLQEQSTHKVRFILFDDLADHSKPYHARYRTLVRFLTNEARNNSLYYDNSSGRWPDEQYTLSHVSSLYQEVREFLKEIRSEIH